MSTPACDTAFVYQSKSRDANIGLKKIHMEACRAAVNETHSGGEKAGVHSHWEQENHSRPWGTWATQPISQAVRTIAGVSDITVQQNNVKWLEHSIMQNAGVLQSAEHVTVVNEEITL